MKFVANKSNQEQKKKLGATGQAQSKSSLKRKAKDDCI